MTFPLTELRNFSTKYVIFHEWGHTLFYPYSECKCYFTTFIIEVFINEKYNIKVILIPVANITNALQW